MMKINVEMNCVFCGKAHSVLADAEGFYKWSECGELIQRAMPTLSATEREQLISGICPKCQASFFGEEEDEGDDIEACMRESLESTGQWW